MSWLLTALGIIALIVLHELGHFAVAKAVGMRVERFSLFFPPTLVRHKRGETEYAIGALPFGGYVKITGMSPEEVEGLDPAVAGRAYYNQAPWKRIAVILAGPGVNILIAFVLFWTILLSGDMRGLIELGNLDESTRTVVITTKVAGVERNQPAAAVMRAGDRILTVDGRRATPQIAYDAISAHRCAGTATPGCRAKTPVRITVQRAGRRIPLVIYPRWSEKEKRMLVGFRYALAPKHFGAVSAAGGAVTEMWNTTTSTLTHFVDALTESKARGEISSIVGISQVGHQTVTEGAGRALVFTGYFSLVLAVINLFPFLPLDGGHVLWSLAEKVRGKRVSLLSMYRFSSVGIVLLLFLVISGVSNDISRLGG